jgi:hypothetical protein
VSEAVAAGRPRDGRIDEAVLAATNDLVAEVGCADLTFRAIAERAGRRPSRRGLGLFIEMVFGTALSAIMLRGRDAVDDAWVESLVTSIVDGVRAR